MFLKHIVIAVLQWPLSIECPGCDTISPGVIMLIVASTSGTPGYKPTTKRKIMYEYSSAVLLDNFLCSFQFIFCLSSFCSWSLLLIVSSDPGPHNRVGYSPPSPLLRVPWKALSSRDEFKSFFPSSTLIVPTAPTYTHAVQVLALDSSCCPSDNAAVY